MNRFLLAMNLAWGVWVGSGVVSAFDQGDVGTALFRIFVSSLSFYFATGNLLQVLEGRKESVAVK